MLSARDRRHAISQLTHSNGHASVSELAAQFEVTAETIRRDLSYLESTGELRRVHGGAVVTGPHAEEASYSDNEHRNSAQKRTIASAALALLPDEPCSIFIDAGTSTAAFALELAQAYNGQRWTIVTNSLPVGMNLAGAGLTGVNVLGGAMRAYTRAVVGEEAVASLQRLRADLAFMGTNGISEAHGLSTPDPTEAAIKRTMVSQAHKVVALCDSTKFNQDYLVTFANLSQVDVVVTDHGASPEFISMLRKHRIEVVTP